MIKNFENFVIENLSEDTKIVWYHGSVSDITKDDLDPLYRHSEKYKGDKDKQLWAKTGSSDNGVGIYFGKDKDAMGVSNPLQYTGFYRETSPYKHGFMYEMKLKPNANVKRDSVIAYISKAKFEELRREGVDALTDGKELNLLNPDAVEYFKKIMQWKKVDVLYPMGNNNKPQKEKGITFDTDEKLKDFLQNYDMIKTPGKFGEVTLYLNKARNGEVFQYGQKNKWFNI